MSVSTDDGVGAGRTRGEAEPQSSSWGSDVTLFLDVLLLGAEAHLASDQLRLVQGAQVQKIRQRPSGKRSGAFTGRPLQRPLQEQIQEGVASSVQHH